MEEKGRPIQVLIADDHAITREGIRTMLSVYDGLSCIGQAVNGKEAVELCRKLKPDVVLMDVDMPELDGISATKIIKEENEGIKVLALTSFADKNLVRDIIKAGANGYLIKNISPAELADAIKDSFYGKISMSPEATEAMFKEIKEPGSKDFQLTEQEIKILGLLSIGQSNKQIAKALFISPHTVKFHISNLFSKLGASSRAEAVYIASQNKLIQS